MKRPGSSFKFCACGVKLYSYPYTNTCYKCTKEIRLGIKIRKKAELERLKQELSVQSIKTRRDELLELASIT